MLQSHAQQQAPKPFATKFSGVTKPCGESPSAEQDLAAQMASLCTEHRPIAVKPTGAASRDPAADSLPLAGPKGAISSLTTRNGL